MSTLGLKIIAVITMFIDHMAASCFYHWGIASVEVPFLDGISLYRLARLIGRIAFPLYCFMIAEGVRYTKNWKKYALRLAVLALLSELPFDFCLHGGNRALKNAGLSIELKNLFDPTHRNVFLTLLLGMLILVLVKESRDYLFRLKSRKEKLFYGTSGKILWISLWLIRALLWGLITIAVGKFASYLHTDYRIGGIFMISAMGMIYEPWEEVSPLIPPWFPRILFSGIGLWICSTVLHSSLEYYGMLALIPLALYNGKKGYSNRAIQYGFYMFYPLHLIILGFLAIM